MRTTNAPHGFSALRASQPEPIVSPSRSVEERGNFGPFRLSLTLAPLCMNKSVTLGMLMAVLAGVPDAARAADLISYWDFEKVEASDSAKIKSVVGGYVGTIVNDARLTDAGGGRPHGGGRGFDVGQANPGWLAVDPAENPGNMMNKAVIDDHTTVVLWQKNYSSINSSSFWAVGAGGVRGFQFHLPWSNGTKCFPI